MGLFTLLGKETTRFDNHLLVHHILSFLPSLLVVKVQFIPSKRVYFKMFFHLTQTTFTRNKRLQREHEYV